MSQSNLIELTYYDPKANVRLTAYADTIITEPNGGEESIAAVRFGGYPEMVRAMSDAIYGGGSIDLIQNPEVPAWERGHRTGGHWLHDGLS